MHTDLSFFDHIVPCGIADKAVTSVQRELEVHERGKSGGQELRLQQGSGGGSGEGGMQAHHGLPEPNGVTAATGAYITAASRQEGLFLDRKAGMDAPGVGAWGAASSKAGAAAPAGRPHASLYASVASEFVRDFREHLGYDRIEVEVWGKDKPEEESEGGRNSVILQDILTTVMH